MSGWSSDFISCFLSRTSLVCFALTSLLPFLSRKLSRHSSAFVSLQLECSFSIPVLLFHQRAFMLVLFVPLLMLEESSRDLNILWLPAHLHMSCQVTKGSPVLSYCSFVLRLLLWAKARRILTSLVNSMCGTVYVNIYVCDLWIADVPCYLYEVDIGKRPLLKACCLLTEPWPIRYFVMSTRNCFIPWRPCLCCIHQYKVHELSNNFLF